jgi:hypothetical protein
MNDEPLVTLNKSLRSDIERRLNLALKPTLLRELKGTNDESCTTGLHQIHEVITEHLRSVGLKDPEDLWNLLITTVADEYWCDVFAEANPESGGEAPQE